MARIVLIGGHGKIALRAYPHLVERGHEVTGVIRNPQHTEDVVRAGGTALVADIEHLDTLAIEDVISGHDVVIWSAGAGGGNPDRTYAVDRDAAIRSMVAAENAGIKRFIMVSYLGSNPEHGVSPDNSFFHYAEAKAAADEFLRSSNLDWTVLGPGTLTLEDGTGSINTVTPEGGNVSRENVARVVSATVDNDGLIGKTVRFNDGDTPIAQALREAASSTDSSDA